MMKFHLIYGFIIVSLIIILLLLSFDRIVYFCLNVNKEGYVRLKTDAELFNPKNGELVGYLKKGTLLKCPHAFDLDDTDLSDNNRFKILVDVIGFGQKELSYMDVQDEIFIENRQNIYYKLDLKKVNPKRKSQKDSNSQ